jgi:hypothetical protein
LVQLQRAADATLVDVDRGATFAVVNPSPATDAPVPEYDDNGVDRTLVRYTLAMSPAERARTHDLLLGDIEELEAAGRAARDGRT